MHPFIKIPVFIVEALNKPCAPKIPNEESNKKLFGIEWAKLPDDPFGAACHVFEETKIALWVSQNWINDPAVVAIKDLYGETADLNKPILDKEQLAAKVLQLTEEKSADGLRYLVDAKDRISALELYAKIAGYVGKVEIDASTKTFLTDNSMTVKFVKVDANDEIKEIEPQQIKIIEHDNSPLKLKLVKA